MVMLREDEYIRGEDENKINQEREREGRRARDTRSREKDSKKGRIRCL
jgi:hypothetical protein